MGLDELQKEFDFPIVPANDTSGCIRMRHDFAEFSYTVSNLGQKVLHEVLVKLNSFDKGENQIVSLTAHELEKIGIGYSKSRIYGAFSEACLEVQELRLHFRGKDGTYSYKGNIPLFRAALTKYFNDSGNFSEAYFALSYEALPYLTDLTNEMRYTSFLAEQTRKLKRATSCQLYELLRKLHWISVLRPKTHEEILVHDLMMKLDISEKYPNWGDFKRSILDPSVKEINTKSDLNCDYEVGKRGKAGKIMSVIFEIKNASRFDPSHYPHEASVNPIQGSSLPLDQGVKKMILDLLPDFPESIFPLIAQYSKDLVLESLIDFTRAKLTTEIKKPVDYFLGILKKKGVEESEANGKKPDSTLDKLLDRSWDVGFDIDD